MKPGDLVFVDSDVGLVISNSYLLKKGVYMIDVIFKGKKRRVRTTWVKRYTVKKDTTTNRGEMI